jgi:hypothetical protein
MDLVGDPLGPGLHISARFCSRDCYVGLSWRSIPYLPNGHRWCVEFCVPFVRVSVRYDRDNDSATAVES